MALVALAPLGTLSWILTGRSREALETSQQETQQLLASSIAGRFDSRLHGIQGQLQVFADSLAGVLTDQGIEELEQSLMSRPVLGRMLDMDSDDRVAREARDFVALRIVSGTGRSWKARIADWEPGEEVERLLRKEVQETFGAPEGKPRVGSPVLIASTGRAVLTITAPVVVEHQTRAVVAGLVDLTSLWARILREFRTPYTVYATDPGGRLFAHSDPRQVGGKRGPTTNSEIVERFVRGGGRSSETLHFTERGPDGEAEALIGSYETSGRGWGIFVQAREGQADWLTHRMIETTRWWSLGAFAVAVLLASAFAGTLSHPVRRLTDAARRFADGDYAARAEVHGRDEIGELAETFNRMAGEIEATIEEVRRKAEENRQLFFGTIEALAEAIDAKDPYTRGHSARVMRFSVIIARSMGMKEAALEEIKVAALLHDVGKIGIDDAILKKPSNLTDEEFAIMKQHPVKGAKIFEKIGKKASALDGMKHHHERFDGKGYPDGLAGENIPLVARIITVADIVDAMISTRPYSRPMTFDAAVARVNEISGSVVDPRVTEAFNRACREGHFADEQKRLSAIRLAPPPAAAAAPVPATAGVAPAPAAVAPVPPASPDS